MKNLHIISLGCPKTRVDSEVMLGLLRTQGWTLTPDAQEADAILVSTCAFLQSSIEESIDTILECADYKQNRCKKLIVAGCLPSRFENQLDELKKELPEVDAFLTTFQVPDILKVLNTNPNLIEFPDPNLLREMPEKSSFAYLKISEGCDRRCAFCAIPLIRGKQVSRPIPSLVTEARMLADKGAKELVLVAQELTHYGSDLGLKNGLIQLLDQLEPIAGIEWIRLMYTYPWNFTDDLIARLGSGKILPYVDIPLQHVSQHILNDMRRHVDQTEQDKLLRRLREIPNMTLRTSLIAGYPGETDADVDELDQWIREIRFDRLGVFVYSPEEGTPAGDRKDQIPLEIREARRDRLMTTQQEISRQINAQMLGKRLRVLVDGQSTEHELVWTGRYAGQAPEIDGQVFLDFENCDNDLPQIGDFLNVEVVDTAEYDLVGRVLNDGE